MIHRNLSKKIDVLQGIEDAPATTYAATKVEVRNGAVGESDLKFIVFHVTNGDDAWQHLW